MTAAIGRAGISLARDRKYLAVEMEAYAVMLATFRAEREGLVVRGISDLADDRKASTATSCNARRNTFPIGNDETAPAKLVQSGKRCCPELRSALGPELP